MAVTRSVGKHAENHVYRVTSRFSLNFLTTILHDYVFQQRESSKTTAVFCKIAGPGAERRYEARDFTCFKKKKKNSEKTT